jgi:Tol biopolymer transport system component
VDVHGERRVLTREYWGLQGIVWSADGSRIVFAGASDGGFYQLYSASLRAKETLVLPSAGTLTVHDALPSGRLLITRDDEDNRLLVRWPGAAAETDVSWKERAIVPSLSSDGSLLAFTDAGRDAGATYATMVRTSDGSPPVRLGEGAAQAISPDRRWVISTVYSSPPRLMLYPVGAGQPRRLDDGAMESYGDIAFFPDGRSVLVCGSARAHAPRCYVRSLAAGPLRAVTPEGTRTGVAITPDGKGVLAATAEGYSVYPVDGGAPRPVHGLSGNDLVIRWSPEGRFIWVTHAKEIPLRAEQLDPATGRRSPLLSIAGGRPGVTRLDGPALADDPRAYTYSAREYVSRIFVVEGVQ